MSSSSSNSAGNMVFGLDCVDTDEQASIQSSCKEAKARAQHETQTACLLEVMHFESKHGMPSAQIRVAVLENAGLQLDLEGGNAQFLGLTEQHHPLLQALQIKGLALQFYTWKLELAPRSKR